MKNILSSLNRKDQGKAGEELAVHFLERNGLRILERNYRFDHGEIDIIAEEGEELVFVEVKTRLSATFGPPEEAVTEEKQKKVLATADGYLFERSIDDRPCRFDVIAIKFKKNGSSEIRHLRDAF